MFFFCCLDHFKDKYNRKQDNSAEFFILLSKWQKK